MIRQFNYLEKCTNTKLLEKFTENDDDANELIENLKNKITKKLTEKNAKTFKVRSCFVFVYLYASVEYSPPNFSKNIYLLCESYRRKVVDGLEIKLFYSILIISY